MSSPYYYRLSDVCNYYLVPPERLFAVLDDLSAEVVALMSPEGLRPMPQSSLIECGIRGYILPDSEKFEVLSPAQRTELLSTGATSLEFVESLADLLMRPRRDLSDDSLGIVIRKTITVEIDLQDALISNEIILTRIPQVIS